MAAHPLSQATSRKAAAGSNKKDDSSPIPLSTLIWLSIALYVLYLGVTAAYHIRLFAIQEYGPVIHEFDPYFNYRAAEYLYWNGAERFFKWFDHKSWYPLGRPVGTTIYPGMQFIAVWLKRFVLPSWSLNDVCCYIPAWFGVLSSLVTAMISYECTISNNTGSNLVQFLMDIMNGRKTVRARSAEPGWNQQSYSWSPALEAFLFTLCMMAIVPAHLMRSVGGGYDNESVAMTAMVLTFYCWVRSLRTHDDWSWLWALGTAASYFYMVAAWGGYVFVLNMIGMHAGILVLLGRFDTKVWASYSIFYALGTFLAIQVPVVGWTPLKSLEQLGPCAVFFGYQLMHVCEVIRKQKQLSRADAMKLRVRIFGLAGIVIILLLSTLAPKGYFGPVSARVRGLFVKHTKTGNPLVDSVAEHQPASRRAYFQYLHHICTLAPIGYLMVLANLSDASSFLVVWATTSYFFSHKMVRLILLLAPIGSVLGGIGAARIFAWALQQWWESEALDTVDVDATSTTNGESEGKVSKDGKKKKTPKKVQTAASKDSSFEGLSAIREAVSTTLKTKEGIFFKRSLALLALCIGWFLGTAFVSYSFRIAYDLSNPSIIIKARDADNRIIKVDDYREAYWWLRDNTPEDARIMAWWDYGYQIAAIANRTTLADGNTWNHEHIALLGLTLTTDLDEGWEIARHWADYVLIWASGRGDDMAKSPHLARIANSVYRDHCPEDPTCRRFGFLDRQGTPSPMMARSLLYRLHSHKKRPGVEAPEDKFQEVYRSRHGWVRIYKIIGVSEESKAWSADIANKKCDAGGWYCPGQYPPAMEKVLARKTDFAQLEDFNRGKGDEEYTKKYFEHLQNPQKAHKQALAGEKAASALKPDINVDEIYQRFEDTDDTTLMWKLISTNAYDELKAWLAEEPHKAFIRSKDGRGPMWWAFEQRNERITDLLMKAGVPHTDGDVNGMTPVDLLQGSK